MRKINRGRRNKENTILWTGRVSKSEVLKKIPTKRMPVLQIRKDFWNSWIHDEERRLEKLILTEHNECKWDSENQRSAYLTNVFEWITDRVVDGSLNKRITLLQATRGEIVVEGRIDTKRKNKGKNNNIRLLNIFVSSYNFTKNMVNMYASE